MEEIKRIAGNFAIEFIEEEKLMERDPLLAIAVAGMFSGGFEYGYTFEGEKEDAKVGTTADKFIKEMDGTIVNKSPMLYLLMITAYVSGANKGFEERDKINIERDQEGNITGITNA